MHDHDSATGQPGCLVWMSLHELNDITGQYQSDPQYFVNMGAYPMTYEMQQLRGKAETLDALVSLLRRVGTEEPIEAAKDELRTRGIEVDP